MRHGPGFDRRPPRAILWRLAVLALYLAALIFGLGMFAVQALSSSDGHHGEHPALPGDVDAHAGETWLAHQTHAAHAADAGWASIFISLRFYMFAAIAFGVVGAPVTAFGSIAPGLTLGVALLTALLVATAASLAFRALGQGTLSSSASESELMGQVGRVLVACEKGRKGKVRLTLRGQIVDFVATTDEPRLAPGAGVIVQEVHAERVHVCAAPSELLPE
jgi:membrane protein implicated in regulation of membrane protease activity